MEIPSVPLPMKRGYDMCFKQMSSPEDQYTVVKPIINHPHNDHTWVATWEVYYWVYQITVDHISLLKKSTK